MKENKHQNQQKCAGKREKEKDGRDEVKHTRSKFCFLCAARGCVNLLEERHYIQRSSHRGHTGKINGGGGAKGATTLAPKVSEGSIHFRHYLLDVILFLVSVYGDSFRASTLLFLYNNS